ncbi:MAG: substrate-binding domain-containing protein [Lachnospiraceae bacterium]
MVENRKQHIIISIVIVAILLTFAAIMFLSERQKEPYRIIYIPKEEGVNNDFWNTVIAGAKMAAEENGAILQVVAGEKEADIGRQNELIAWAVSQKPDAIVVSPCSYLDSTEALKKIKEQGITLTLVDSVVEEEIADCIVATDNIAAGQELGTYAASILPEHAQIAIVGHIQAASTAKDREKGVRLGLGAREADVKEVVFCGSVFGKAYELTLGLIKKYPDLSMIIGLNEYSAVGAARAIRDSGMQKQVKMLGFDSSIEEIQLMEEGIFQGIIVQKPFSMGYLGIEQTIKQLKGEETQTNINSGAKLITANNMYTEENQKLLFPFVEQPAVTKEEKQTDK